MFSSLSLSFSGQLVGTLNGTRFSKISLLHCIVRLFHLNPFGRTLSFETKSGQFLTIVTNMTRNQLECSFGAIFGAMVKSDESKVAKLCPI